jgi:hypothetical protein
VEGVLVGPGLVEVLDGFGVDALSFLALDEVALFLPPLNEMLLCDF